MTLIKYGDICDGVASTLRATKGVKQVESYKQIKEAITATPTLHIYPTTGETGEGDTSRMSFTPGVSVRTLNLKIDGYARAASHVRHDIPAVVDLVDAIESVLEVADQDGKMYGLTCVQAHHWSWERVYLKYGETEYAGVIFTLRLTIF